MGDKFMVIITARHVDVEFLNKLALNLRDPGDDEFSIFLSLDSDDKVHSRHLSPPVDFDPATNSFAGMSIADVEAFIAASESKLFMSFSDSGDFIVIDDEAVQRGDCVLLHADWDIEGDENEDDEIDGAEKGGGDREEVFGFKKARVPPSDAFNMVCNLSVANLGWEDFCPRPDPESGAHWYFYGF
ncbi:hypothetical protein ANO11243_057140 [Dothideomycetidae sp. 11243]|nr:hypothetical protein ANO11243_057140 [fungal sp. No.11243]